MSEKIIVSRRFCGPPASGNGGYACGLLAGYMPSESGVEVRLLRPVPLETPLTVDRDAGRVTLSDGEEMIAEARLSDFRCEPPAPPTYEEAQRATGNYIGFHEHPFPTCFVCGPARPGKDGLAIFAGKASGTDSVASHWIPDATLAGADGMVRDEFIWAALDCPGAFAAAGEKLPPIVLGTLAVKIEQRVAVGQKMIVIGWEIGNEGRKFFAGTALFSSAGQLHAFARATWIRLQ